MENNVTINKLIKNANKVKKGLTKEVSYRDINKTLFNVFLSFIPMFMSNKDVERSYSEYMMEVNNARVFGSNATIDDLLLVDYIHVYKKWGMCDDGMYRRDVYVYDLKNINVSNFDRFVASSSMDEVVSYLDNTFVFEEEKFNVSEIELSSVGYSSLVVGDYSYEFGNIDYLNEFKNDYNLATNLYFLCSSISLALWICSIEKIKTKNLREDAEKTKYKVRNELQEKLMDILYLLNNMPTDTREDIINLCVVLDNFGVVINSNSLDKHLEKGILEYIFVLRKVLEKDLMYLATFLNSGDTNFLQEIPVYKSKI